MRKLKFGGHMSKVMSAASPGFNSMVTQTPFLSRLSTYNQTELVQKFWIAFIIPTRRPTLFLFKFCLKKSSKRLFFMNKFDKHSSSLEISRKG